MSDVEFQLKGYPNPRQRAFFESRARHTAYGGARGTYMLRRGFTAYGLFAAGGTMYLLDQNGYVCRFEEGETYDGARIDAY